MENPTHTYLNNDKLGNISLSVKFWISNATIFKNKQYLLYKQWFNSSPSSCAIHPADTSLERNYSCPRCCLCSTGQTKENIAMFPVPLLLLFLHQSSAFSIISADPSEVLVRPGDTVRMLCVVDEHYEWCKFYHPSQGYCDYEWKRISNNITRQECALNLSTRLVFHGQYDDRQCGVEFTATTQDTGVWK